MLIGEGPGKNEDITGLPFVGRSGILLNEMLNEIGLSRQNDVYIANIIKCRPPSNRDPSPNEINSCLDYLRWQFIIIKPVFLVCLGRIASTTIIKRDFKVTCDHGIWYKKKNINIMGTFHPAALLRNPNNLPKAREDFKCLKEKFKNIT
jgi:DNA polymerase